MSEQGDWERWIPRAIDEALQFLLQNQKLMMQTFSIYLGDTVYEERGSNYGINWSNWDEVMKSGKLMKIETLYCKLELAVLIASMHPHDDVEVMEIDNWMKELCFWPRDGIG
jgi:hypothetical protein